MKVQESNPEYSCTWGSIFPTLNLSGLEHFSLIKIKSVELTLSITNVPQLKDTNPQMCARSFYQLKWIYLGTEFNLKLISYWNITDNAYLVN